MSIGIVVVTHGSTAESLISEASFILDKDMSDVLAVHFNRSDNVSNSLTDIQEAISRADTREGVIVLSDLIGATPCNRVAELLEENRAVMVTGVNLAMLLTVLNYREEALGLVARKAVESGRRSVKIFQK